jgi:hypothetical protein
MSEPIGLKLEVGGDLPTSLIPDLLEILNDELYNIIGPTEEKEFKNWKPGKLEWYATSNWGECEELKAFLCKHKLPYIHTCNADECYNGSIAYWFPEMRAEYVLKADSEGSGTIDTAVVRPLMDFLLAYIESGDKAFPLFIDSKLGVIREIVSKGLKGRVRVVPRLRKYVEALMPGVPELPLFRLI